MQGAGGNSNGTTALLTQIRQARDALPPQPSVDDVMAAQKAISKSNEDLISALGKMISQPGEPAGVAGAAADAAAQVEMDTGELATIRAMKEEQLRQEGTVAKRRHVAVVELDEAHQQYSTMIRQLEHALVKQTLQLAGGGAGKSSAGAQLASTTGGGGGSGSWVEKVYRTDSTGGAPSSPTAGSPNTAGYRLSSPQSQSTSGSRPNSFSMSESFNDDSTWSYGGSPSTSISQTFSAGETTRQRLSTIQEDRERMLECPPALLKLIEDAISEKREKIDVSQGFRNALLWIPDTIGAVSSLTHLNLSYNRLLELPETVGQLQRLTMLDASYNQLLELPVSLGQLSNLKVLNLQQNKLEEVPPRLGECASLTVLNLGFNSIKQLPESLGQLTELQTLHVHLNCLKRLPKSIGQMRSLVEVDVHFNYIQYLPETLGQLTNLRTLNVSSNHYQLEVLPKTIGQMVSLEVLDIHENQIKVLPDSLLALTQLKTLSLEGNPLRVPPLRVAQQGLEEVRKYMQDRRNRTAARAESAKHKSGLRRLLDRTLGLGPPKPDSGEVPPVLDPDYSVVI
eukprot:jgi/Mesen1/10969/ME000096S10547